MGLRTVARDDFTNARRSPIVLGVIGAFAAISALVFAAEIDVYDDAYRTLYDVSALVAFVFPLFVAPLAYLSIAGERSGGRIKFSLGLPNSRRAYFLGKYVSRTAVAVAAVALGTVVGFGVAAATFVNGADPVRFLAFGTVSVLFATAISGLFVAISATTASRSRAMFGVFAAYFVLVPFWYGIVPQINLPTVLDGVTGLLGVSLSTSTEELIVMLSPGTAYLQGTQIAYEGVFDQYEVLATSFRPDSDTVARTTWFPIIVLIGWSVIAPVVGYLRFRASELG